MGIDDVLKITLEHNPVKPDERQPQKVWLNKRLDGMGAVGSCCRNCDRKNDLTVSGRRYATCSVANKLYELCRDHSMRLAVMRCGAIDENSVLKYRPLTAEKSHEGELFPDIATENHTDQYLHHITMVANTAKTDDHKKPAWSWVNVGLLSMEAGSLCMSCEHHFAKDAHRRKYATCAVGRQLHYEIELPEHMTIAVTQCGATDEHGALLFKPIARQTENLVLEYDELKK